MVYFVPVGLILASVVLIAGGIYGVFKNITNILLGIFIAVFILAGIARIIMGIISFLDAEDSKKGFYKGLVRIIQGLFTGSILLFISYFLDIGAGHKNFNDAEFIFFGSFEKFDLNITSILISLFILLCIFIIDFILKRVPEFIYLAVSLVIMFTCIFGIGKIGFESEIINKHSTFNWTSPEYETITDTSVNHKEFFKKPIKTGSFPKGTKLYSNKKEKTYDGITYYEVTDGKTIGYVSSEDLESIVTYTYIVNTDSPLYSVISEEIHTSDITTGKELILTREKPGTDVIMTVKENTEVTKIMNYSEIAFQEDTHMQIKLSDGTEGFIDINCITEIRK